MAFLSLFRLKRTVVTQLTKRPVAGEHEGEVGDDVECGVDDVSC